MASRYKLFLRLCEEWKVDKTKSNRDLGLFIRKKVSEVFKNGENTTISQTEKCDAIYDSLQKLNTNYYQNKYPRKEKMIKGPSGLNKEELNELLSDEGIQYLQKRRSGILGRFR